MAAALPFGFSGSEVLFDDVQLPENLSSLRAGGHRCAANLMAFSLSNATIRSSLSPGRWFEGDDMQRDQDGHALAMVVVVLTVLAVIAVGLARLGARAADLSRARVAADASALAAASGGLDAGRRLAAVNHAEVVQITETAEVVRVTVRVGDMTAAAAATLVERP